MTSLFESSLQQKMLPYLSAEKWVIALSGGKDSRVLLDVLAKHFADKQRIIAVYVNHGLSQHAMQWQDNCAGWCQEAGVEFFAECVDLSTEDGESLEQSARIARYQVLQRYVDHGDVLITGHHQDDQLETVLLALKRGSGPKGLSAMAEEMPWHNGRIIRPLLSFSRDDIEQYANYAQLAWNEDESNQDSRFDRNFLRNEVIPLLKQRWPSVARTATRSAQLCAEQEVLIEELLSEQLVELVLPEGQFMIEPLKTMSIAKRNALLRRWLIQSLPQFPSSQQLNHLWENVICAKDDANPTLSIGHFSIRRYNSALYILPPYKNVHQWRGSWDMQAPLQLPDNLGSLTCDSVQVPALGINRSRLCASLSVVFEPAALKALPVGRSGTRSLKKIYQEQGIPSWQRRRLPIVLCGHQVVTVANLFVDQSFAGNDCQVVWHQPEQ